MTRRTLSPVALSRLTWTADDRRAWDDAYRAAVRCHMLRFTVQGFNDRYHVRTVDYNYYGHSVKV